MASGPAEVSQNCVTANLPREIGENSGRSAPRQVIQNRYAMLLEIRDAVEPEAEYHFANSASWRLAKIRDAWCFRVRNRAVSTAPVSIKRLRGRPRRYVSPERVRELRMQGLSFRQIASRTGFGYGTVRRAFLSESAPPQPTPVAGSQADAPE